RASRTPRLCGSGRTLRRRSSTSVRRTSRWAGSTTRARYTRACSRSIRARPTSWRRLSRGPRAAEATAVFRSPLALKIGLLIVVVLIVGFGVSTILTIQREAALLIEQNKVAARRLTATLVASIEGAMLQERPDVTRTVIQELRQNSPVDAVDIYRRTGMEAFTDLTTAMEVDRNAGLAPEVMSNIKKMAQPPGKKINDPLFARAIETVAIQEALETRGGTRYFTLLTPIQNKERCQGCHGSDHQVRAVVRVATSMEPVFAEVAHHRNRQLAIGLLTIVAAGAVLTATMQRIVLRPVAQLAMAA